MFELGDDEEEHFETEPYKRLTKVGRNDILWERKKTRNAAVKHST